jgi:putative transposase
MSRPLRIERAGGLYHVTSRGDRREAIYRDDQDRTDWLAVLGEVCSRFNWRCYTYCEMTNHYLCEASHKTCNVKSPLM